VYMLPSSSYTTAHQPVIQPRHDVHEDTVNIWSDQMQALQTLIVQWIPAFVKDISVWTVGPRCSV